MPMSTHQSRRLTLVLNLRVLRFFQLTEDTHIGMPHTHALPYHMASYFTAEKSPAFQAAIQTQKALIFLCNGKATFRLTTLGRILKNKTAGSSKLLAFPVGYYGTMDISATESSSPAADLSMEWSSYFPPGYYGSGSKKEDVGKIKAAKKVAQRNDDAMPKTANQNGSKGKRDNKFTVAQI